MMRPSRSPGQGEVATAASSEPSAPSREMKPFYALRFVSSWSDRLWLFAIAMLLVTLPDVRSLGWVAVQLFFCGIAQLAVGSLAVKWANRHAAYLESALNPMLVQKAAICLSAAVLLIQTSSVPLVLVAVSFSALAHVAFNCYQTSITKKWLPPYCNGYVTLKSKRVMKYIDLACSIAAPLLIGAAMKFLGGQMAALIVIAWQIVSAAVEGLILNKIYTTNIDVFKKEDGGEDEDDDNKKSAVTMFNWQAELGRNCFEPISTMLNSWRRFGQNELSWVAISLSALLFTVISFDALTMGYLRLYCLDETIVAAAHSAACVAGFLGSISFPLVRHFIGLRNGGITLYVIHLCTTILCFASFALPGLNSVVLDEPDFCATKVRFNDSVINHSSHLIFFISSAVAFRFTLLLIESAIQAVFEDHLSQSDRPHFNNVQPTLASLFDLSRICAVMLMPFPSQFGMLVLATLVAIATCGGAFFWLGCPYDLATNLAKKFSPQKKNRK